MAVMRWTVAMSVGVPELDDDHQGLIEIINALAGQAGGEAEYAAVHDSLKAMQRYALVHFDREEKVMRACGFPHMDVHQGEHREFTLAMQGILARFGRDPVGMAASVADEAFEFLKSWLTHHILLEDMAYKPYVEQRLEEARAAAQTKPEAVFHQGR